MEVVQNKFSSVDSWQTFVVTSLFRDGVRLRLMVFLLVAGAGSVGRKRARERETSGIARVGSGQTREGARKVNTCTIY